MITARRSPTLPLAAAALLLLASACSDSKSPKSGAITIKGNFGPPPGALTARGTSRAGTAAAFDPSTIRTVVVFDTSGAYSTAPVVDGRFSVEATVTRPAGVIFAGAADEFLGALSLGSEIGALPLSTAASGVSTIDLQTLTASGTLFVPGHNPIGDELPLTPAEQTAFAQANGLFAQTVQNPDIDGNGVIDVLEGKFFKVFVGYSVEVIPFGGALTPALPLRDRVPEHSVTAPCPSPTGTFPSAETESPPGV